MFVLWILILIFTIILTPLLIMFCGEKVYGVIEKIYKNITETK